MANRHLSQNLKKVVQVISHHGILSEEDLQEVFQKICGNDNNVNFFKYIKEIDTALNEVDLTFKSSVCELTGQKYWALSSTVLNESDDEDEEDQPSRKKNVAQSQSSQNSPANDDKENDSLQSSFTRPQRELFKLICENIILLPARCISSNNCINLVCNMKGKIVRSDAEKFLKEAIKGLWFTMKDGQIYIGPRSIAELMPFFKANYGAGLTSCTMCQQLIFYGHMCTQCDNRTHYYCLARLLEQNCALECPRCQETLDVNKDYLSSFSLSSPPECNSTL